MGGLCAGFCIFRAQARVPAGFGGGLCGGHSQADGGTAGWARAAQQLSRGDRAGRTDFDLTQANAAYVYDNALAGLLLLAAGHGGDAAGSGEALAMAQANDRFWKGWPVAQCLSGRGDDEACETARLVG